MARGSSTDGAEIMTVQPDRAGPGGWTEMECECLGGEVVHLTVDWIWS